ncbi:Gfo/Idh/MocA family oxidoreductase [Sediminibacterium sp.]|uniref:Gfo/Idh/MocA family oxidoreductase n=1 Tax=Sediminibacterium sp. TaxID=1917865 RepID=UPI002731C18B|nr:Gfo/Idh/MocA family oxidoreductase [Sediminibacterium sp.]MDP2420236.1 Gfo/Idh/MocA family oxidoreductase [Sediminibacterium sp.]
MRREVFLIGTGQMAMDYLAVLNALNFNAIVIGRGKESAVNFENKTGVKPFIGGIREYLLVNDLPENSYVIIATGTESLMDSLLLILNAGASKVLIEKPAALSIEELLANENNLKSYLNKVFVAYNRRFYASVIEAQKMIEEDGGLSTIHFEFTEWAHKIEPLAKAKGVKENWFFANSTHVIDLAFFLAGKPHDWKTFSKAGKLEWHPKTNFTGAGITEKGVLFSYLSNWESAGRWGIELLTPKRRIYLRPLESISVQEKGKVEVNEHKFDDTIDIKFKPGLFNQIKDFMNENETRLLSVQDHIRFSFEVYSKILDNFN